MAQYYMLPIITEACALIKMGGVPMKILSYKAGVDRTTVYKWGQKGGNGATVGVLVALLDAAGYELKIRRKKRRLE